ncbi:MAG: class I SAM-dependent methyltransferase [Candidatus Moraniibacteriota bacterium]
MSEYSHSSREGLAPRTPEQNKIREKIEHQIEIISPEEYDKFALERRRDEFAVACRDLLERELDPGKIYETLEVGAGTGISTNRLNELNNLIVTALDKKKDFLEYAIKNGRVKKEQAVVGDFNQLPFTDESFDLYTGMAILNQREDISGFYKEAVRVLKKDGLLFIPWTKTRANSIEREKSFFQQFAIDVKKEGDWFIIGKKINLSE